MTASQPPHPSLLLVEDSSTQRELLKHILEGNGYTVLLAENGRQALEALRAGRPAAIISDVLMPEVDGYELCRILKADARWRELPVILLTALSEPKDVIRGLECGADDFVVKPYDEDYLIARVEHVLNNSALRRDVPPGEGLEVLVGGRKYVIDAGRRQILNLLLSTYEAVVRKNKELLKAKDELNVLNEELEAKVKARTAALTETNEQLETFVYSVAHNLRAPLRGMQAFARPSWRTTRKSWMRRAAILPSAFVCRRRAWPAW